jgi:hypothetical protein
LEGDFRPKQAMKTFSQFLVKGHSRDQEKLQASFSFSFDNEVEFTETINFTCEQFVPIKTIDREVINNLLFHLSLAI